MQERAARHEVGEALGACMQGSMCQLVNTIHGMLADVADCAQSLASLGQPAGVPAAAMQMWAIIGMFMICSMALQALPGANIMPTCMQRSCCRARITHHIMYCAQMHVLPW